MTQDLRQAILALTNAARAMMRGEPVATDERVIDNVLALMPAGPILETLWAGLPVPIGVVSGPEGPGHKVEGFYADREQIDKVHAILAEPLSDHTTKLRAWATHEEAVSAKAKLEREHALEKRLLAERDAFDASAPDNPLRIAMRNELLEALMCDYPTSEADDNHVDEAMARLSEAATKPLHVAPASGEDG